MLSRPVRSGGGCPGRFRSAGYTLVEVLIATTLALMLMAAVAQMFAQLGTSVNNSRATLETADRLRACQLRLQMDLEGLTVTMLPPRRVENEEGYFEYIEGGAPGSANCPSPAPINSITGSSDSSYNVTTSGSSQVAGTVGETGDILMFTTRNSNRPFSGMYQGNTTIQSETAEIAWFMRGHNLYRRVLLVVPGLSLGGGASGFYASNDISVHLSGGTTGSLVANTLGDLTRRECRFAHNPNPAAFPYLCYWGALGLPTLRDSIDPGTVPSPQGASGPADYWNPSKPFSFLTNADPVTGALSNNCTRTDDLILTNVIGFDVKVWDPGTGGYVDSGAPRPPRAARRLRPKQRRSRGAAAPIRPIRSSPDSRPITACPPTTPGSPATRAWGPAAPTPARATRPVKGPTALTPTTRAWWAAPATRSPRRPFPFPCGGFRSRFVSSSPTATISAK